MHGVSGGLLVAAVASETSDLARARGPSAEAGDRAWLSRWWERTVNTLGPATSLRALLDQAICPLMARLGFEVAPETIVASDDRLRVMLRMGHLDLMPLLIAPWATSPNRLRSDATRLTSMPDLRWCLACCGCHVTLIDTRRAYARAFIEFDLDQTVGHDAARALFLTLLRPRSFVRDSITDIAPVDDLVSRSEHHRHRVGSSLHRGVYAAVVELVRAVTDGGGARRPDLDASFELSLILVYRVLFLLFAEARQLVPAWHPTYRDSYTIEALRRELSARAATTPGVWESLRAISRLADRGCHAADLQVTGFDGDLFGRRRRLPPRLDDGRVGAALTALTMTPESRDQPRRPIAYDELGVEQLGAVYETVLEYRPGLAAADDGPVASSPARPVRRRTARSAVVLERNSARRKSTGTYYTPRAITEYLVRRALRPLTARASAGDILRLRIVDPSMGSGAFLVAACRYLASAYEEALVRDGSVGPDEVDESDRAGFRRAIAQRCLFGVDLNPMAVQLARLSLWLTTLAADRPLTFLDHHLRVGDSLVGASLDDLRRQPPGGGARTPHHLPNLPLFDSDLRATIDLVREQRTRIETEPGDTVDDVRRKSEQLEHLTAPDSPLQRLKTVADLWCAPWFWPDRSGPPAAAHAELVTFVTTGRSALPHATARRWLATTASVSKERAFFHWSLEFPEVFHSDATAVAATPRGFDAVVGNPPWNMARADHGAAAERRMGRTVLHPLVRFCRDSGIYRAHPGGQTNVYQLFVDRTLQLLRPGGTFAMVLPGGVLVDHGSAGLRRRLLADSAIDAVITFDNREAIFPIHRGVRFALVSASAGGETRRLRCRFGETDPAVLDRLDMDSHEASGTPHGPIVLTRGLIERISGPPLGIPELRSRDDIAIVEALYAGAPALGSAEGWRVKFGRELNATEDRGHLEPPGHGLPVLEGKQIEPFRAHVHEARYSIPRRLAEARLGTRGAFTRPRLAYRDVAAATNRLTLIAAMLPADVVTTHTLFCVKSPTALTIQWFLCGVLNSYVTNYLVRLRVGTHVTVATVEALPVPVLSLDSDAFLAIARSARRLSAHQTTADAAAADLQARVAAMYGLDARQYAHVLDTFPLVPRHERTAALERLGAYRPGTG